MSLLWLQDKNKVPKSSVLLRDAVLGSAAAPISFRCHHFEADGKIYNLVDGGMGANNPVNHLHTQAFMESYFQDLLPFVYTIHSSYSSYLMKLSLLCRHCLQYVKQSIYLETEVIIGSWSSPLVLALKENIMTSSI